jgi:hydrogenase maturation protease
MTLKAAGDDGPVAGRPPRLSPGDRVLLFGIGNDLRGDDGAGPRLALALEGHVPWDLRVVHGLTPELADDLAGCDVALFVDASADPGLERPTWTLHGDVAAATQVPAAPAVDHAPAAPDTRPLLGHALDVPGLLALTRRLHGRVPPAATLALPARDFGLGERLTPVAEAGVRSGLAALVALARAWDT